MRIGVLAESFGVPLPEGIANAAALGLDGVQIYAVEGQTAPEHMTAADRIGLRNTVQDHGMVISAVCADMGEGGFAFEDRNVARIERTQRILDLALDLGCRIITTHIGVVPSDEAHLVMNTRHPRVDVIARALDKLGDYARGAGSVLAIETGPESATVLLQMLRYIRNDGIRVNLDPANLVMSTNEDPVRAVHLLKDYIVHTHAKDGQFFAQADLDVMYGMEPVPPGFMEDAYCLEVPLGQGQVDFVRYVAALRDVGYDGFLTIERETGCNPYEDIRQAAVFLRGIVGQYPN